MSRQSSRTVAEAPPGETSARRGRPREIPVAEREELILDAMERVVVGGGLSGATMDAVAREAGMSKRTLYAVFSGRDELFAALVRRWRVSVLRPLAEVERDLPLRERLLRLLRPDIRHHASEARTEILRALIAEAPRQPALARAFVREGPRAARGIVRAELDRAVALGEVEIADTAAAAHLLCDMAYVSPIDRLIDPEARLAASEAAHARLDLALDTFLAGVERRGG